MHGQGGRSRLGRWAERILKENLNCRVTAVELEKAAGINAEPWCEKLIIGDVEQLPLEDHLDGKRFHGILMADVLEHLMDPWGVLKRLAQCISLGGYLVSSIPNSRYLALIDHLVNGHWTYQSSGLLDKTHLRFFTLSEISDMFQYAGFSITALHGNMGPLYPEFKDQDNKREIRFGRLHIKRLTPEEFNEFFVFQYLVQATLS